MWHLAWVYMDIEEVLGYLRMNLLAIAPCSCEVTMVAWELGRGIPFLG